MQLGKIYNNDGLKSLARSCYLMILSISKDDHVIQKVNSLLFTNEREIQMNQQKIEQSSSDFLDLLIQVLLAHSFNNYDYNIDIELYEFISVPYSSDTVVVNTENEKKK